MEFRFFGVVSGFLSASGPNAFVFFASLRLYGMENGGVWLHLGFLFLRF